MDMSNIAMPEDQKQKCHTIIHGFAALAGFAALGTAQLPTADTVVITPLQVGMIVALGKVFDQKITKSAARAIFSSVEASFAGRATSQVLVGWVPLFGNAVNATTAAGLTEFVGWNAAGRFYKKQLSSIGYKGTEGKEQAKAPASDLANDETADKCRPLEERAGEFLCGQKTKQENREEYDALLNDIEHELDAAPNRHLLDIYDRLLAGKVKNKKAKNDLLQVFPESAQSLLDIRDRLLAGKVTDREEAQAFQEAMRRLIELCDPSLAVEKNEKVSPNEKAQDQDRACEIKVLAAFPLENVGKYRVTTKISNAPIHVGDIFALLVDDRPTDKRIAIRQIGFGERQWVEKEPDTIETLFISSDFEYAYKLKDQRFICVGKA